MAYRFRLKDKSVELAVRRIAREQVDGAIAAIAAKDPALATHEVRRCCKKLRGLIRLIRPGFAGYALENAAFRDLAQLLSGARDAKVMSDTFELLVEHAPLEVDRKALKPIRARLAAERESKGHVDAASVLDQCRVRLGTAAVRIAGWELAEDGWGALESGLLKVYGEGRADARSARPGSPPEVFHDMRKLVKYHWYHTRLLEPVWPGPMRQRANQLAHLGDLLGLHHDVCVLAARVSGEADAFGTPVGIESILALADARRAAIEKTAVPQMQRLYALRSGALGEYWHALWRVWRN